LFSESLVNFFLKTPLESDSEIGLIERLSDIINIDLKIRSKALSHDKILNGSFSMKLLKYIINYIKFRL